MIYRKFNAPNVEYNEIDRSQYGLINDVAAVGTMTFFTGFADKGDDYDVKYSRSLPDFINTYGYPTNEAERYFYNAAKEIFARGGRTITSKIPYDNDSKDKFSYSVYTSNASIVPFNDTELSILSSLDPTLTSYIELSSVDKDHFQDYLSSIGSVDRSGLMTMEEYDSLLVGNERPKENSLFIVNITRNRYSKDPNVIDLSSTQTNSYLGYIPVLVSPWNALYFQGLIEYYFDDYDIDKLSTDETITSGEIVLKTNDVINLLNNLQNRFNVATNFQTIPNTETILISNDLSVNNNLDLESFSSIEPLPENTTIRKIVEKVNEIITFVNSLELNDVESLPSSGNTLKGIAEKLNEIIDVLNNRSGIPLNKDEGNRINQLPPLSTVFSHFAQPIASSEIVSNTVSKMAADNFPSIKFFTENRLDRTYLKQIGIVVFKMVSDTSNDGKINFVPVESFVGSLDRNAKDEVTGKNIFIDNVVNENSETINVFSNFNFKRELEINSNNNRTSKVNVSKLDEVSMFRISNQTITSLGFFVSQCSKYISSNTIEKTLDTILDNCKDPNSVPMDIICDAGMSNIAQYMATLKGDTLFYEPEFDFGGSYSLRNLESTIVWKKILKKYDDFAKYVRKDCIFVADGMRPLCLIGNEKIVRRTAPKNTIAKNLIPKIRYMLPPNSSYGAGYCNWFRCIDDTSRSYFWCPPSIKAVGVYLYTDRYANTWDAPAGDTRGRVLDVYDIAFNPTIEEAQSFYEQQWNYAIAYPLNGIVLEGQKTFQTDKTALDRVNVRRLCNGLKKGIKEIARWFKYEGITPQVLTRFRDQLTEFLQRVQLNSGISEFYIKLDEENNTPETADRNEIHAAIAIRPVKTAEFIIINSIVVNQSANLEEVMNSVLA